MFSLKYRLRKLKTMWTSLNNSSQRTIESKEKALSTPLASSCIMMLLFNKRIQQIDTDIVDFPFFL